MQFYYFSIFITNFFPLLLRKSIEFILVVGCSNVLWVVSGGRKGLRRNVDLMVLTRMMFFPRDMISFWCKRDKETLYCIEKKCCVGCMCMDVLFHAFLSFYYSRRQIKEEGSVWDDSWHFFCMKLNELLKKTNKYSLFHSRRRKGR